MPIDYAKLKNRHFDDVEQRYDVRDTILYALGLGYGGDPTDAEDLRFVYEANLRVLPTMAVVIGTHGFWLREPDTGVAWQNVLHGEQGLIVHRPIPPAATVVGRTRVTEIVDKGAGRAAHLFAESEVFEKSTGELLATRTTCMVLRGEGGFGGPAGVPSPARAIPDRPPDAVVAIATVPQAALIYRLSGDWNPLHADPGVAASVGFPRPILHGLCTFGVAGRAISRAFCAGERTRLASIDVRFTAPVFPGETIRTDLWRDGDDLSFRSTVVERSTIVLDGGRASLRPA